MRTDFDASEEFSLLDQDCITPQASMETHDLSTAPLITKEAYDIGGYARAASQYGVMGRVISTHSKFSFDMPADPRLYLNTNAPFSAIVCGVQGSGKSHTVSVMLENMLIPRCSSIGALERPLSGLVLHFGEGGPSSLPSEAAWLAVPSSAEITSPTVQVFVSKSSLKTMRTVYEPLGGHVVVEPLTFSESELDAQAFLSMMAVGSSDSAPLYVQVILTILRELGENYTYQAFMRELEAHKKKFNPAQLSGLEQRMSLLTSFMEKKSHGFSRSRFAAGMLTIIDLSDPFIDPASACGLFEIITRLFIRADVGTGKVLVVDEAHKYLSSNRGSCPSDSHAATTTSLDENNHQHSRAYYCASGTFGSLYRSVSSPLLIPFLVGTSHKTRLC